MVKVIELFSGLGAQREALNKLNIDYEVVAISEIDKFALLAYKQLHGKTNNLGDISKIDKLPKADLWTYSFPCTDISLAGRLKGFEKGSNTHSSLLWEVQRLLNKAKENEELPKYLLMENVKNLVSKKFLPLFNEFIEYLTKLGYKNYYKVLNAKNYGIPQNRERVFMVSILGDENFEFPKEKELKLKLFDLLESKVDEKYYISLKMIKYFTNLENGFKRGEKFKPLIKNSDYSWTITTAPGSRATDTFIYEPVIVKGVNPKENFVVVPQATKAGYAIGKIGDGIYTNRCAAKRGVVQKNMIPTLKTSVNDIACIVPNEDEYISIRRLTPYECLRLMGWNDNRIDELIKSGLSDTQLYKLAGNSIVINCLEAIFKNLLEKEEKQDECRKLF